MSSKNVEPFDWSGYMVTRPHYSEDVELRVTKQLSKLGAYLTSMDLNVLEIGSGHGIYTVILANLFKTVLATEPNPVLFGALKDIIQTREISNVATTNIAAEDITLAKLEVTKNFDIICCFNSFRFIEDKDAMLDKFASLLRKTKGPGYVLISSPAKFATIDSDKSCLQRSIATIAACYRNKKFRIPFHGALTKSSNGILLKLVV